MALSEPDGRSRFCDDRVGVLSRGTPDVVGSYVVGGDSGEKTKIGSGKYPPHLLVLYIHTKPTCMYKRNGNNSHDTNGY